MHVDKGKSNGEKSTEIDEKRDRWNIDKVILDHWKLYSLKSVSMVMNQKIKSPLFLLNLWLDHENYGSHVVKSVINVITKLYKIVVSIECRNYHKTKYFLKLSSD